MGFMKFDSSRKSRFIYSLESSGLENARKMTFKRGDFIFRKGDAPHGLYYIQQGLVGLVDLSSSGNEVMLRVFGRQYFTGHRSIAASENYHASAVALKQCEVYLLPLVTMKEIADFSEEISLHLVSTLALELRISEEKFNDITGKSVLGRISENLLFLKNRHPDYCWTRKELGEFCGAQTETVTRALTKLENEGLIRREGREIIIENEEHLLAFAEQN